METQYPDRLTYEEVLWEEDLDGFELMDKWVGDEWRWGVWEHYVYRRESDDTHWQYDIQMVTGEGDNWWQGEHIPPNHQVYPEEIVTVKWNSLPVGPYNV